MQYHNMLKQKHEMEQRAAAETAAKKKEIEQRVSAAKKEMENKLSPEEAAEKAAKELLEAEEREKAQKK